MRLRPVQILCLVACAGTLARDAQTQTPLTTTTISGTTQGGAFFRIAVPDPWNGDLVVFNHGLNLSIGPDPDLGPLSQLQLAQGFAVAASSFRQVGWALFRTKSDLQQLYREFVREFGTPDRVFLHGASLGGLVTAQAIEQAELGNVVAAYNVCGAVAGSRNWDIALDLRLIYDVVCASTPGAAIPGGAEGLPEGSTLTQNDIALRVNACTGLSLAPQLRTPRQRKNLERILSLTTLPESYLLTDMIFATIVMSDLVHDDAKLRGRIGTRNDTVRYRDRRVDARIERVAGHPGAIRRLERHFEPSGRVGDVRIVSLHTDKDGLVVVENESEYAAVVPRSRLTTAVVVEAVPTHCGFTGAELVAGWESLRAWVDGGPKPTAASIAATCQQLLAFGGPCRIDPGFVIPDMDSRVPPR